jgi:DNA-binding response OmpR family regulator
MLPTSNPVVLVADDEPSMLELVAQHLKTLDDPRLVVLEASDGEQAWKLAREHLPDLVVLDVMMPGMSGWEVCRKIREDVALAHTGVVMLTGIGENLNQMTSPLYGADAYIDKPFDFDELDEKVKAALSARALQRDAVQRPTHNAKNVNGVSGPAKAAKGASRASGAKKKSASNKKKRSVTASSKNVAAAKAKARLSSKSKLKPRKGETKMAAKKAKKAKKTAKKKTAKKKAK